MDYEKLIEEHECLRGYFTDFPKKLMRLAKEKKVLQFYGHGLLINYENVHEHLSSPESLFPQCSLMDFFETLQVLQFSRSIHPKKIPDSDKTSYIFINPNFVENEEVPDDFYKQPIDINKCNMLKGTKRMTNLHHIGLFDRLIRRACATELKISRLEFARMRIDYEFQRRDNLLRKQVDLIEHDVNEPQYLKDNEIAGYYGNVPLKALKIGFRNYFPMYQSDAAAKEVPSPPFVEEPSQQPIVEQKSEEIIVDILPPAPSNILQTVPLLADASEDKENQPPSRKRKYKPRKQGEHKPTRKSARITQKETDDALTNLQKEFDSI